MNINEILKSDYDLLCKDYKKAIKKIGDIDKEKNNLQERIDKAIEYIEKSDDNENSYGDYDIEYHFKKELLDILKGE